MEKNRTFAKWRAGQDGATAIEYALIAAAISLALTMFIFLTGDELAEFYATLADTFASLI